MQDINGNGLPDDQWYELKGSEAGKDETIRNFEVTYYHPEGKKMDVQWISSDGRNGWYTICPLIIRRTIIIRLG